LRLTSLKSIAVSAFLAVVAACAGDSVNAPEAIVGIQVEPRNLVIFERTQATFYARAIKRDGPAFRLDPEPVRFVSRDTSVLTITPFGIATGVKIGSAWIVATFDNPGKTLTDSLLVHVTRYAE